MTRASWQDLYFVQETSGLDCRIDLALGAIGLGGSEAGPPGSTAPGGGDTALLSINPQNNPDFDVVSDRIANPLSIESSSYNRNETIYGVRNVSKIRYTMGLSVYAIRLFFKHFLQNITSSEISTETVNGRNYKLYESVLSPYTSPDPSYYLASLRCLASSTNNWVRADRLSWEAWGGIVDSITISGQSGSLIQFDADLNYSRINRSNVIGIISNDPRIKYLKSDDSIPSGTIQILRESTFDSWSFLDTDVTKVATDNDFTAPGSLGAGTVEISESTGNLNFSSSDLSTYSGRHIAIYWTDTERDKLYSQLPIEFAVEVPPLKFQDCNIELDGNLLSVNSFSLSLQNNPMFDFYDEKTILKTKLGRINAELTVNISWGDSNFGSSAALRDFLMEDQLHEIYLYWGNKVPSTYNDVSFYLPVLIKKVSINENKNELNSSVTFELIKDGVKEFLITLRHLTYFLPFAAYYKFLGTWDSSMILIDLWNAVVL